MLKSNDVGNGMGRKKIKHSWVKKNSWVGQAFIVSSAVNVGLLSSLVYIACKKNIQPTEISQKKSENIAKPFYVSTSSVEILSNFFEESYESLFRYLGDDTLVEDGYRKRDFALACLVSFHHFDIQKALSGSFLQERALEFVHKDGGERIRLKIFPGLDDEQFDAVEHFAKVEKWPLTNQGLFFELQRQQGSARPQALKETFYLSSEFNSVWMLFNSMEKTLSLEEILELMLESDWRFIEEFHRSCMVNHDFSKDVQRSFLSLLVERRSKSAAKYLIENDLNFVLKKLDDARVIYLLSLIDSTTRNSKEFASQLVSSVRSDAVHKSAGLKLYDLFELNPPKTFELAQIYKDFNIKTDALSNEDVASEEKVSETLPESKKEVVVIADERQANVYVVQKGDSLWVIAKKFKVKISDLKEANNIKYSPLIKPGMKLKIP